MRLKLKLEYETEIDTQKLDDGILESLIEKLKEGVSSEPDEGEDEDEARDRAAFEALEFDFPAVHDAIKECLEDDFEGLIDLSVINETHVTITKAE